MRIGFTTDAEIELLEWAKQNGFGSIAWMRFDQSFAAPGKERWREDSLHFAEEAKARGIRISTIGAFYRNVTGAHFENETVRRAVDGALTCILGREAAARKTRLTMDELLKENRKLAADLRGLKT